MNNLCCSPRVREQYNNQYTFGVDKKIQNFKDCGYKYIQKLPPVCNTPLVNCVCSKNYYDEEC